MVGVGYPHADAPDDYFRETFTRRDHDLTPTVDASVEAEMTAQHGVPVPNGDAPRFLAFIQQELVPFIESTYRADPARRVLAGHSYGGLFGAYALFAAPGFFQTSIIGSPYLAYDDRVLFKQEAAFAASGTVLPATVYLYAADEELVAMNDTTLTDTLKFAALLEHRQYEGLKLHKLVFMEYNHCEVAAPGLHWGLMGALRV
ncbi:MAG: alpha/beta hydrolase-fold protein [Chloroflexota bacterium]